MKKALILAALVGFGSSALLANAGTDLSVKAKVEKALKMKYRTEEDKARDDNRNPLAAIEFMGLKDDMKVVEFGPGNGWYTKILAPVLKDKGELVLAFRDEWMSRGLGSLLKSRHLSKVTRVGIDMDWDGDKNEIKFNGVDFKTTDADMFLNIRFYHNLPEDDRKTFNDAVFKSLKPGGTYVVITHSRRHMSEPNSELWRREDPVRVIKEIEDSGFTFTKYSNMFYRPDDELRYEVGRKSVEGNTDRFFFVFNKPK